MNHKGTQERQSPTTATPVAGSRTASLSLRWMLSLAVAEWFPMAFLLTSMALYKRLGMDNEDIAYYSSLLFLPWVFSPVIERLIPTSLNSRNSIVTLEIIASLLVMYIGSSVMSGSSATTLSVLFLLSGTCGVVHNVEASRLADRHNATDNPRKYTTIQTVACFVAVTACHGLAVSFAGNMEVLTRNVRHSWEFTFYILAGVMACLAILHCVTLPSADTEKTLPDTERNLSDTEHTLSNTGNVLSDNTEQSLSNQKPDASQLQNLLKSLRTAPKAWIVAACIVVYLLPEGFTMPSSVLFFIDARHNGGLGLSPSEYGLAWGTEGFAAFLFGLFIGKILTDRWKPGRWMWLMAVAATIPNIAYLYLSREMPTDMTTVSLCVMVRQAVTGFGLSLCLHGITTPDGHLKPSKLRFRRAAIIALPMFIGGMHSGILQDAIGYRAFFAIAIGATVVTIAAAILTTRTLNNSF